jgi:hypothetical protein
MLFILKVFLFYGFVLVLLDFASSDCSEFFQDEYIDEKRYGRLSVPVNDLYENSITAEFVIPGVVQNVRIFLIFFNF